VVSSSTSEERTSRGYNGNRGNGGRQDYKPRSYNKDNRAGTDTDKKDYRSNNNGEKRDFRNQNNVERKDFRKRDGSQRPYNNRYNKNDDYGQSRSGNNHGKNYKGRSSDSRGSTASQKETKIKEQQPDKMDIVKRLEKEKKVMQKKNEANNKKAKGANARPQVKVKRTNNIDWTKEYENDSFDDDDMFYTF
jgi:hypothetical protein